VFFGEADTSGVAVTAVRNYAFRGDYVSAWAAVPGAGTVTSKASNLGTDLANSVLELKNVTAERGFTPAQLSGGPFGSLIGADYVPIETFQTRNTTSWTTPSSSTPVTLNASTGVPFSIVAANWNYRLRTRRTF
jgi:hypothetical protein